MTSSAAAKAYFAKTDYFASCPGDWLGKGAKLLGLEGAENQMHFWSLADNLHPQTGERLTTYARDGRRVGVDFTFNAPKSVSLARELGGEGNVGDDRVEQAHRDAVAYTVGLIESEMQARVRAGGENGNRTTGNLVAHRDTRINPEDQSPDPHLHDHVFIFNATFDPVEQKWKACEIGQVKHDAPYYEAIYHARLAANLKNLGYGVDREGKWFKLAGVSRDMVDKFSRRSKYIDEVAAKLGIVNPKSKAKLGATTRLGKAKGETEGDLQRYYASRLTDAEKQELASLIGTPGRETSAEAAVAYAIGHEFERQSVVEEKKVYETALRHGVGSVTVDGVQAEARRQGLLVKDGKSTTVGVLAEEKRIIAFAREGRGTCRALCVAQDIDVLSKQKGRPDESMRPLGKSGGVVGLELHNGLIGSGFNGLPTKSDHTATLSPEQQATSATDTSVGHNLSAEQARMVNHVLTSHDRVMLVVGDAGTGKTHALKSAFARIDCPVAIMAPGAEASRGVLRRDGFSSADTVTSFLNSQQGQAAVKNGVIWVDEAGQLPIRDLSRLVDIAQQQNARIVLQGDPKQHRAVARDGNMMRVLEDYAGLPVARLSEVRRQTHAGYKRIVEDIAHGGLAEGLDGLGYFEWVKEVEDNKPLVAEYLAALDAKKTVLAIAPTHAEADGVTADIREALKARGVVGQEEHTVKTLVPLHLTEAQRADPQQYSGHEVIQYHHKGGSFKAGDRIAVADFQSGQKLGPGSCFAVFRPSEIKLSVGDRIRVTANGKTADGHHRLDNGSQYTVSGFGKDGSIRLENGWHIAPGFGHLTHGYVATSHASQGKTVDRVLIAMGEESLPAISAEQFYVSVSRGRERAMIFTDVPVGELRDSIQRADTRQSATELMHHRERSRLQRVVVRGRDNLRRLRERAANDNQERQVVRKRTNGR